MHIATFFVATVAKITVIVTVSEFVAAAIAGSFDKLSKLFERV
jgi:hypothetical protein